MGKVALQVCGKALGVNFRTPSNNREEAHNDQGSERQIESRAAVRQALWEALMQSPVSASEEALKRTEGAERAESSTAGGSET